MLEKLSGLADPKAVVALVLLGMAVLVFGAASGGPAGQALAAIVAVLIVVLALMLIFAYWIKRMNEDIGGNRREIDPEFEEALEEYDSEE
jgi:membrane protein implicated in regulation of membrane protease activity